jgi:hypothetical protein
MIGSRPEKLSLACDLKMKIAAAVVQRHRGGHLRAKALISHASGIVPEASGLCFDESPAEKETSSK